VTRIGTDAFGDAAMLLLKMKGLTYSYISSMADIPTGVGFIMVEAQTCHNLISHDTGAHGQCPD
jgi:sugar/nucleoside kinase (ribokinase family)